MKVYINLGNDRARRGKIIRTWGGWVVVRSGFKLFCFPQNSPKIIKR